MDEQKRRKSASVRKPLSCRPCRNRKLKCDRGLPACSNCVHRGQIIACSYASRSHSSSLHPPPNVSETASRKLDNLERLVTALVNQQRTNGWLDTVDYQISNRQVGGDLDAQFDHQSLTAALRRPSQNAMNLCTEHNEPRLSVDEARWASVLSEIHDVRTYLHAQHERYEEQAKAISSLLKRTSEDSGPTLLFGSAGNMDKSTIISHLPSRYSCDIMVSQFFSHMYPLLQLTLRDIIHRPTFEAQYEQFWLDPQNTSIVWVSLLFGILRIAMLDYIREGDEPVQWSGKCQDFAITFRRCFTDCLIFADYLQPHEFLIEALILHQYAEYISSKDAKSSVWVLIGMLSRLAMRMGYHHPSQPTLSLTPFKAEMRRRAWAYIRQADIIVSWQMGLPSMTDLSASDDALPRNIYDDERFHEDCKELPPALPDSEPTQISFLIAKTKLNFGFARAVAQISKFPLVKWETVVEMEQELRRTYDNVPARFKLGPLSGEDTLVVASARYSLACIHYKSLCVIHSGFLEIAKTDHRYAYSSRVCLSSAMSILRLQAIQDQELPLEGKIRSLTDYQTSLTIHNYLLAAAIISTHLCSDSSFSAPTSRQALSSGAPTRTEMIKALETSARIFSKMRDQSNDACRAADVLEMLVKKFEVESNDRESQTPTHSSEFPNPIPAPQAFPIRPSTSTASNTVSTSRTKLNAITSLESQHQAYNSAHPLGESVNSSYPISTVLDSVPRDANRESLSIWPEMQQQGFGHRELYSTPEAFPLLGNTGTFSSQLPHSDQSEFDDSISYWRVPHPSSSSATLATNNPLYTLWNLNASTQGGVGGV